MFSAANKKNNNRRFNNRVRDSSNHKQRNDGNSFKGYSSNSFPNHGNLNMVPPTGKGQFDLDLNFQDQTVLLH